MRVAWLLGSFGIGGAERLLLELLPHLPDVDFIPLAVTHGDGDLEPLLVRAGLHPRTLESSGVGDLRWLRNLRKFTDHARPDLVHAHLPYPASGARLALARRGIPVVYTEHGQWSSYHPLSRWANALTFPLNKRVLAVSEGVQDSILSSRLGRSQRTLVEVVPNGIDVEGVVRDGEVEPLGEVPVSPAFGAITHLTRLKGPDVLIEAASILHADFPDSQCVIVGSGPLDGELRERARRLRLGISFLGFRPDARSILRRLMIAVFPSRREGLPLALLEAMALARPVVATAVGGIPEVIEHERTGLLVPPEDPPALAAAIGRLMKDEGLREELARNGRAEVERNWSIETTAARHREVYGNVLM